MDDRSSRELLLSLPSELAVLPVATSFVEKAAVACRLGPEEALSLTLAAEELFVYLCTAAAPGQTVTFACRREGYFVELDIRFQATGFSMRAFNITTPPPADSQAEPLETGLFIASRMVDRFRFELHENLLSLILIKEKTYPEPPEEPLPEFIPEGEFAVRTGEPEEIKLLARAARAVYPSVTVPDSFAFPGKVADMAACDVYHALVAVDGYGRIGGGLVWQWESKRLVEFFGPYVFHAEKCDPIAEALVEACIEALARTGATGLISRSPTNELPKHYFEKLGAWTLVTADGTPREITPRYRHLEEDFGFPVWASPEVEAFLRTEYERLFFAREIRLIREEGEESWPSAVFSVAFDRPAHRAVIKPVWFGSDAREVLKAHVDVLIGDGLDNLFFEMDLGHAWHTRFTDGLLQARFEPRLVLPYAGKADVLVFQHRGARP